MTIHEHDRLEFKQSFSDWKAIVESVAAFATSNGGTITIGIADDGTICGTTIGKGTLSDISNKIKQNTDPAQFPAIREVTKNRKNIVYIRINECPIKPVFAFGRAVKRIGNTNQHLSRVEMKRMLEENSAMSWDILPCKKFKIAGFSKPALLSYLEMSGLSGDQSTLLKNLKLLKQPKTVLNGAVALFALRPALIYPQVLVKCGRFAGVNTSEFIDEKEFDGNIFDQLDRCMAFIKEHTFQSVGFTGTLRHQRVPQYPEKAVREAIVNALCHRDYSLSAHVQIRIFDDRLEVWSPGLLPPEMSIERLRGMHESIPRNPRIAYALHRAGFAEQWGTGTTRIIDECTTLGIEVDFMTTDISFIVRFTNKKEKKTPVSVLKTKDKTLLNRFIGQGNFTRKEFEEAAGLSKRQSVRELTRLVKKGQLEKTGKSRSVSYRIMSTPN